MKLILILSVTSDIVKAAGFLFFIFIFLFFCTMSLRKHHSFRESRYCHKNSLHGQNSFFLQGSESLCPGQ